LIQPVNLQGPIVLVTFSSELLEVGCDRKFHSQVNINKVYVAEGN